jgi:serine/threonine protein phosphatase PrpC
MKIRGAGLTDIGRQREQNEDNFLCDISSGLFIVADGMGGRASGEIASEIVVTLLPIMLKELIASTEWSPNVITLCLHETLCQLSQYLNQQSQTRLDLQGLGSTAVVLFIRDNMAYTVYAGDSRAYLLRNSELSQITEDQTIAAALVRIGHLSQDEAAHHPLRHSLEEYIGKEGKLNPGFRCKRLRVGDRWLLCSDGLTKGVPENELRELLLEHSTPEDTCQTIISRAKDADGTDNITAIVVDIIERPGT